MSGHDHSPLNIFMILDVYHLPLAFSQLDRLAYLYLLQIPQILHNLFLNIILDGFMLRLWLCFGWWGLEFYGIAEESVGENGGGGEKCFGPGEMLPEWSEEPPEHRVIIKIYDLN
jgi:hypothetical protein